VSSVSFDAKRNTENLTILYFNARSILPKMDNLAAICFALNPDIVCIVESWFGGSIADNEVSLPGYSTAKLDRNRHGGGILIYIKCNLSFRVVLSGPSDLELIFVSVQLSFKNKSLLLGTFYRQPSSHVAIFDSLFDVICSLDVPFLFPSQVDEP